MKEKICNFECTEKELWSFLEDAERGLAPKDLSVYSLDVILKCIDLYSKGDMTKDYLELWARAYAYLLDYIKEEISKKEFLLAVIADYVRRLSACEKEGALESCKDTIMLLDSIYNKSEDWNLCYSVTQKRYPTDEVVSDIEAVFDNAENMEYIILYKSIRGDFPIELEGKWLSLTELSFFEAQFDNFYFTKLN